MLVADVQKIKGIATAPNTVVSVAQDIAAPFADIARQAVIEFVPVPFARRYGLVLCQRLRHTSSSIAIEDSRQLLRRFAIKGSHGVQSPSVIVKINGLDLGADDYIAKPFYMAELSARIKSVMRRGSGSVQNSMSAGNIMLDLQSRRVNINGKDVPLLKKEFDILLYFMQRPEHIVDKAVLAEAVWGDHIDMVDNFQFVYAQIKNLRKKLAEAGANINIKAVYGFGYKFTETEE